MEEREKRAHTPAALSLALRLVIVSWRRDHAEQREQREHGGAESVERAEGREKGQTKR